MEEAVFKAIIVLLHLHFIERPQARKPTIYPWEVLMG